ncbi:MAG: histidinol dehydrogenase [Sedimentibacter sp.]|uniref:histidinol dehydrogenase n=1 Tax=Sedimentibacter sp. TaxID=1960295 RepID=UPI00315895F7
MIIYKEAIKKTYKRDLDVSKSVSEIINNIIKDGDKEIISLSKKFENIDLESIRISKESIKDAYNKVDYEIVEAMKKAAEQIKFYAEKQLECLLPLEVKTSVEGVTLGHRLVPVESVGAYVPGGRYPLPSTALMLSIPAKVAGVKRVAACSPASKEFGTIHPAVLVALDIAGVDEVYCVGGAQAIAALTYGTETIKSVDLIAGPGNKFVTEAKRQVLGEVGIDSLAGPSEVLIIADEFANPKYVAIDLLAQSEHDPNARATLLTTSEKLAQSVINELNNFANELSTGEIARKSWEDNGTIIITENMDEAIKISNEIAPEHLEVHTKNDKEVAEKLMHFGSLFIGEYTPVAFGDYCSGTNHTLPTMRTARYSNGVWVGTFIKTSFYQHITKEGCENLSNTCIKMAGVEGLFAHQKSVIVRVNGK